MHDNKYYLQKITPQHKKPKFLKWLEANLNYIGAAELVEEDLAQAFDLESAVGKQLDILGEIIGRKRLLDFQPEEDVAPNLDDELYNLVLRAKIGINHWDGTIPGMLELWANLFPEYKLYVKDNQDMSMDVNIVGPFPILLQELAVRNYLVPKPMGVRINYGFYQFFKAEQQLYIGHGYSVKVSYIGYNDQDIDRKEKQDIVVAGVGATKSSYVGYNDHHSKRAEKQNLTTTSIAETHIRYIGKEEVIDG